MLIQADASQLEWRTLLELSRDETGIEEVLGKQDVHSINEKAFTLPSRLIAKTYLFRTIYNRGKGYAFTVDPNFMHVSTSVDYWDEVGKKFYKKYKGVDECHLAWGRLVAEGLPIIGPSGRFWSIPKGVGRFGESQIPWNTLTNYPVQGTGADVMAVARVAFRNRLRQKEWGTIPKLRSTVHDSIVVDTPAYLREPIVNLFHQVFDDIPKIMKKLFDYDWVVPLDCECKWGPNMKDMTKVKRTDL